MRTAKAESVSLFLERYAVSLSMPYQLPNRQTCVNRQFAYLALDDICQTGKITPMEEDERFPNRIREWRRSQELTVEELAERTGLSVSYVSRLEHGARNLSMKNLNLFAHALGVSQSELLPDSEQTAAKNVVAVMGRIGAGAEILPEFEQLPPEGLYEIETPFPLPSGAIAFEVSGDSMWPRYDPGDVIICWDHGTDPNEILGWEAAVKTADGKRYLKRVVRGATSGTYDLESHNAAPIRAVKLDWVAAIQSVIRSGQWRKSNADGRRKLLRKIAAA